MNKIDLENGYFNFRIPYNWVYDKLNYVVWKKLKCGIFKGDEFRFITSSFRIIRL